MKNKVAKLITSESFNQIINSNAVHVDFENKVIYDNDNYIIGDVKVVSHRILISFKPIMLMDSRSNEKHDIFNYLNTDNVSIDDKGILRYRTGHFTRMIIGCIASDLTVNFDLPLTYSSSDEENEDTDKSIPAMEIIHAHKATAEEMANQVMIRLASIGADEEKAGIAIKTNAICLNFPSTGTTIFLPDHKLKFVRKLELEYEITIYYVISGNFHDQAGRDRRTAYLYTSNYPADWIYENDYINANHYPAITTSDSISDPQGKYLFGLYRT